MRESDTVQESDFNIKNIIDQQEAIKRIKHYDVTIKTENKNNIRYESIQGQVLKNFKDTKEFVQNVGLSKSAIYFENWTL